MLYDWLDSGLIPGWLVTYYLGDRELVNYLTFQASGISVKNEDMNNPCDCVDVGIKYNSLRFLHSP